MKKYCVYMHINKLNSKKYIGITCQKSNSRWKSGEGYKSSPHFYSAIKKYGWNNFEHLILYENLSEDDAKEKEKYLISEYDIMDSYYGYNLTEGGDGATGYGHTDEQIEKMRQRKLGYRPSEETREKMRQTMIGREFTDEWKQKISESHIGDKNPMAKSVVQLDCNYKLIKEFSCERYAEQELGIAVSHISAVCLNKEKSAGGFIFMFKEDYEEQKEELANKSVEILPYKRPVVQLSLIGEYINTYDTITEATRMLNIDKSSIINVCKGKRQKTAGGFRWAYKEDFDSMYQFA